MIDPTKLWIGDVLKLKSSGRVGKFEGMKNSKLRINVSGKIILTSISNVEFYTENKISDLDNIKSQSNILKINFDPVIDLHIEKLAPSMINYRSEHILLYQIRAAKNHLLYAIENKIKKIEIIHGRGTGALKSEILFLVSQYSQIIHQESSRNGGALVIFLC